jgi:sugar-phosphatase
VVRLTFRAVVFDCDGVLVDSSDAVDAAWRQLCAELGLPLDEILPTIHGVRASDTLARWVSAGELAGAVARLEDLEVEIAGGTPPVAGARDLVAALHGQAWGVATSGSRRLASARLTAAGFPLPEVLIGGDDVRRGKPHPDPYLAAVAGLAVDPAQVVVFEDSPTGAAAARAAGVQLVAVATTYPAGTFDADVTVSDLREVAVEPGALVFS